MTPGKFPKPVLTDPVKGCSTAPRNSQSQTSGSLKHWMRLVFCRRKKTAPYPGQREHEGLNVCLAIQLDLTHPVWLRARGTSMLPWRLPGSEVKVEPPVHDLQPGAIVVFRRGAKLYYHRIITRINQQQWLTKGDTLIETDEPVSTNDIIGLVTAVRRKGRAHPLPIDHGAARISCRIGRFFARFHHPARPGRHVIRALYLAVLFLAWPFRRFVNQHGN